MATKEEIREWLERCGAGQRQLIVYNYHGGNERHRAHSVENILGWVDYSGVYIFHLLNPKCTGIQGPTFAEWQKAKGREGKVQKIMEAFEEAYNGYMWPTVAEKILDAIEEE